MVSIIFGILLAIDLFFIFFAGGSLALTIPAALLCVAGILSPWLFPRLLAFLEKKAGEKGQKLLKWKKQLKGLFCCILAAGSLLCGSLAGIRYGDDETDLYNSLCAEMEVAAAMGDLETCENLAVAYIVQFGETETVNLSLAKAASLAGVKERADLYFSHLKSKTSREYYVARSYYVSSFSDEEDETEELRNLWREAAMEHPDWGYANLMAGVAYLAFGERLEGYSLKLKYDNGEWVEFRNTGPSTYTAQYYLALAYGQEPQNPLPAVYLGVISCMQAHFGEAEQYFQAAEERMRTSGMDSELQDTIDTYRQIMKEA